MIDWLTALQTFNAVIEEGSFARAAKKLVSTPSTVTKRIQWLEHELGVELLIRTTRSQRLTRFGEMLFQGGQGMLNQWLELKQKIQSQHQVLEGHLRLATTYWLGEQVLNAVVADYLVLNPGV